MTKNELSKSTGVYFAVTFVIIQNLCLIYGIGKLVMSQMQKRHAEAWARTRKNKFRLVSLTSKVRFKIWPSLPALD